MLRAMRFNGLGVLVGMSIFATIPLSGCDDPDSTTTAREPLPPLEATVSPDASRAADETALPLVESSEDPVAVAPVVDCAAPTVELTGVQYSSALLVDHPDAIIPRGWDYTITNSGTNEVEVWGVDLTINFKPTPESVRISGLGYQDELFWEGWQVGPTLHPPILSPGESIDMHQTYYGGSTISTSIGKPTVTLGRVHYDFIDEDIDGVCPHE